MKKKLLLGALIICSQLSKAQWAQSGNMTGVGDYSMCKKGTDVWAGTTYGTYKSTNNGVTFTASKTGIPSPVTVYGMASSGSYLFAAGAYSGLYISSDNGANWSTTSNSLTTLGVVPLMENSGTVYAGTTGGLFTSTDNGSTWTISGTTGLTNNYIRSIAMNGSTLYVGTDQGPFSSTDNGSTWVALNAGVNGPVSSIAFDGSNIYITLGNDIYMSSNVGSTWASIKNSLTCNSANTVLVINGVILLGTNAGFAVSSNNGTTWTYNNTGFVINSGVKSILISGTNILAGLDNGGVHHRALSDFGISAGVKEIKNAFDFSLSPNPSNGSISISTSKWYNENMQVSAFDILGNKVFSSHLTSAESKINLGATIAKGVYFIQVNDGTNSVIKKIIVE